MTDISNPTAPAKNIRVRFAPSPTGVLHIGGIRTALYNYLLAKQQGGTFILRIEDTDQGRYVEGAEAYIAEALQWCGLTPDEGPGFGGEYGPYRQSERKDIYLRYALEMIENGTAYYAFDTPAALDAQRQSDPNFKYGSAVRLSLSNSLTLGKAETDRRIAAGEPWVIRLKVEENETIHIQDLIRGEVNFQTSELDDKVLLKSDGMPTYHLANIVDDHLMKITHVIRGEEWLPSTAHHVLLYRALNWEDTMPQFAHLPLIMKPVGTGKLSKRDGAKLGIPVFPLSWKSDKPEDTVVGFREYGFLPKAVVNFLALLGWSPGTEQEIFSIEELSSAFSIEKISKSGARFDFDKAKWFNQQYIMATSNETLAAMVRPIVEAHGHRPNAAFLEAFCGLMKERVTVLPEFWENGYYFFEEVRNHDLSGIAKKWKKEQRPVFDQLLQAFSAIEPFDAEHLKAATDQFMAQNELKPGDVLPALRIALAGTMKGPAVFDMMVLLGKNVAVARLQKAFDHFDQAI